MNKQKITGAETFAKCYISAECDIWNDSLFNHTGWRDSLTGNRKPNDCVQTQCCIFRLLWPGGGLQSNPIRLKSVGEAMVLSHYERKTWLARECCFFLQWCCFHVQNDSLLHICHHHAGCGKQLQMLFPFQSEEISLLHLSIFLILGVNVNIYFSTTLSLQMLLYCLQNSLEFNWIHSYLYQRNAGLSLSATHPKAWLR